jgi:hypothetical protein
MAAKHAAKISARSEELSNVQLAELLAREAEKSSGILVRAFRRAARRAFLWPEQAVDLIAEDPPLTELAGVGPFIAKQIQRWIDKPPKLDIKFRFCVATFSRWPMGASCSPQILHGSNACAVICKCTPAGATAREASAKWRMPPRRAVTNTSLSRITPKA